MYDDIETQDCFSYPRTSSYSTLGLNVSQIYGILTKPIIEILHYQEHSKVNGVRLVEHSTFIILTVSRKGIAFSNYNFFATQTNH